jgi:hypothetical protein
MKCLEMGTFLLSAGETRGHETDTSAVRATHRDASRRLLTQPSGREPIASIDKIPGKRMGSLSERARERPPLHREGVMETRLGHRSAERRQSDARCSFGSS